MGHLFEDEKPNYKKKIVKEYLKNKLVFGEYETLDFEKVENWVEKVKKEVKGKKVMIDVDIEDTSEGFNPKPDVIWLKPYYERKENDKEYKESRG